jgi:hypothetical protein
MMKIFNGTPHSINIVKNAVFTPSIRKYVGGTIVLSIPSNGMLSANVKTVDLYPISNDIPVFLKTFTGVDSLPDGYDVYIVSAMYASAAKSAGLDMTKIFTVSDPVYTDDGNSFVGCRGLCTVY